MCACKETGVIRNDMGNGCYQFAPCICTAGNQSPEEVDGRRHDVLARLEIAYQMQMEGKWNMDLAATLQANKRERKRKQIS
ncbi:hypothetical protein [Bacillus pseudomycoides]|uniref:hypothetical protein n=1 Tax=Bacillus pseudomycoides TaxID=64104 RepID=UPI000BEB51F8|nr:hypothetical protein [Bacillus pseudomycoides]PEB39328.1 hypothetical protein COO06_23695 [Bacillus pseudomycoides]PGD90855.1 hypothetical protein COM50_24430 [Bacillus pseudomycoides]PGD97935.1 hypothetical protein COM49_24255 [Bacillus pseudomycoides]PHE65820.1 hypothetical protein COF69_21880 [Bacillus pseudomycoides]PHG16306.1 hypothetical protein COI47_25760 [Bacillus pseudomycoides]